VSAPSERPRTGPAPATELRKWYFCANDAALNGGAARMVAAAVRSCLANTALEPNLIYSGRRSPTLRWLRDAGVVIHRHEPSLEPALRQGYGAEYDRYRGHWLRLDIPQIETRDEVVLYTDIDVVFLGMPAVLRRPETIAVAPERWRWRWREFNSGVMLMTLPGLRAVDEAFRASVTERLTGDFRYPAHDQTSYRRFFADRAGRLPLSMNWKPYWGPNAGAHVVHFHGPKPPLAAALARGDAVRARPEYEYYWRTDPAGYAAFVADYEAHLPSAPDRPRRAVAPTRIVDAPAPSRIARLAADTVGRTRDGAQAVRNRSMRDLAQVLGVR
jgi:hypothetical protein